MSIGSKAFALCLSMLACTAAAQPYAPRLYETTVETGLPHLEENLRYATTRSTMCLGRQELATAFPILRHEALKGCRLDQERQSDDLIVFALHCEGGSSTSGAALWQFDDRGIRGTLDVKLGGKNMTLYQRMSGRAIGACTPAD
jgi:hypothetical protein